MSAGHFPEPGRQDACPGALRPHTAADGLLIRVRLPGGLVDPAQLRTLAGIARDFGDGHLELTSRANIQLRALTEDVLGETASRLSSCELLPSVSHERVRNIVASPMSGHGLSGNWDIRPVVAELDSGLRGEPSLAALSGRFLFALDDGSADILSLDYDVGLYPVSSDDAALMLAGRDSGLRVARRDGVSVLIAAATEFLAERIDQHSEVWRLAELADGPVRLRDRLLRLLPGTCRSSDILLAPQGPAGRAQVGVLAESGDAATLAALVPLGRLSHEQAEILARLGEAGRDGVTITPWRTVMVGGLDKQVARDRLPMLDAAGLSTDPQSPWAGMYACAGRPRCAKALADVRADVSDVVQQIRRAGPGLLPVHWAGCARRCGKPSEPVVEVVATGEGYEVTVDNEKPIGPCSVAEIPVFLATARKSEA